MKKFSLSFAFTFIFIAFIAFGAYGTYSMETRDMSNGGSHAPCTFMGEALFCSMSPFEHMQYFRNFLFSNFPQTPRISPMLFALAISSFYVWRWMHPIISRPKYKKFPYVFLNPVLRIFTKIRQRLYA